MVTYASYPFFMKIVALSFFMMEIRRLSDNIFSFPYLSLFFLPVAVVTLFPINERYASASKLLIVLIAIFSGALLRNITHSLIPLLVFCLLYSSVFWSVSPSLSLHGAIHITYYVLLFSIFRYTSFTPRSMMWGIRILVLISIWLSIRGLSQIIYGYEEYAQYLDSIPSAMRQMVRDWVEALSGRVFSKFALPSQLAGYLLMILPLNFLLLFREQVGGGKKIRKVGILLNCSKERLQQICSFVIRIFWGGSFLLNCLIFFHTKSFGAWISFLGLLAFGGYLFIWQRQTITWRTVLKGSIAFFIGGLGILYVIGTVRGQYLWDLQGNNPLWYRFLNWKAAIRIFFDHPFLGTGFLTFGKMYPQYMFPGANESQYVHNSYLQIGAELGLIGFIVIVWLVGHWCVSAVTLLRKCNLSRTKENLTMQQFGIGFFFGGLASLLHNIVDFDCYVFPLGALGISLLALALNVLTPSLPEIGGGKIVKSPHVLAGYGLIACIFLSMYFIDWQYMRGKQHQENARTLAQAAQYEEAYISIQHALQNISYIPEYRALEGNLLVYLHQPNSAIQRFQSAIQDEPETPWFHARLAEAYAANYNISMAYVESRRAAELFPQKHSYQERVQEIHSWFSTFKEPVSPHK
jgi:O-antigen ligase